MNQGSGMISLVIAPLSLTTTATASVARVMGSAQHASGCTVLPYRT